MRRQLNNHGEYVMNAINNTKHTPGPWYVTRHNDLQYSISQKETGYDEMIEALDEEDEANAKLIAAAPELLEALKDLLGDVMNLLDKNDTIRLGTTGTIHIVKAKAAIQKATV
jgi:hypothetical protein